MKVTIADISRRVKLTESKRQDIVNYDIDNAYPQRILEVTRNSGVASRCAATLANFIEGEGFQEDLFNYEIVNRKGNTVRQLLAAVAKDYAIYRGFAVHVNYNALYEVVELQHIPFEYCRYNVPDDADYHSKIAVYNNWDKSRKNRIMNEDVQRIDVYNPYYVQAQVDRAGGWENYKGQVLYYSADGNQYPLATIDPELESAMTDAEIKNFHHANITTNFMASHIFEVPYELESEEERESLQDVFRQFQGADNASKLMLIENKRGEISPFKITKMEIADNDSLFETTEASVHARIRKLFGVPPVLMGDLVAGKLGTAQEIEDATTFFNAYTRKQRMEVEQVLGGLFGRFTSIALPSENYTIKQIQFMEGNGSDTTDQ